jgi:hypothetical protein
MVFERGKTMLKEIKKVNGICMEVLLAFFVIYSVFQCTSLSLKIPNSVFIILLFLLLTFQVILCMKSDHINIFSKNNEKSIFTYIKSIDYVVLAFLLINSIWILFIPKLNGFPISTAIKEAGILLILLLYFPIAILIRMKEIKFNTYYKIFYWSIFVLACWHIVIWFAETVSPGAFVQFLELMSKIPFVRAGDVISGWGIVRIVVTNSVLLGVGLMMTFAKINQLQKRDILCTAVFTASALCTFLRSIWLGVVVGLTVLAVYFFIAYKSGKKKECRNLIILVCVMIVTTVILDVTVFQNSIFNRMNNAFIHNTPSSVSSEVSSVNSDSPFNAEMDQQGALVSNNIKLEQSKQLLKAWLRKPLSGYGYGSYIKTYLRSNSNYYSYEMTTFSLLMKTGIIGFSAWALLALASLWHAWKVLKNQRRTFMVWIAVALCFLVAIQTNPLLFSANSISLIMYFILFTVNNEKKTEDIEI